ncbi:MAG TPA: cytochrome ubiquinol oxidase subunit I [Rubricoccaceae bacterium]|nr:cytochrome ubiquinol oxidase subunit I [Rubricoccaceae bacterium]
MDLDPLVLSRLQFALTIMFHYLFPPLTIGLGAVMVGLEGMYLKTREPIYEAAVRFWTRLFAVNFAMGVATGLVMEFEFGTNWAAYSRYVGDVFGSALAAEGIFAFFLESGFLAVLVFGWDRVGPKMHFFATFMVFLGGLFSSIWIVVANSWMQTPAGFHIVESAAGPRAEIVDFWAMVFNPSSVVRLLHVWVGAFILGAFFALSISAWYLLKRKHVDFAERSFKGALVLATVSSLAALFTGHLSADVVAEHQPPKLAAFEGHFETGPATLFLFGIPDPEAGRTAGLDLPGGLSFLTHFDFTAPVVGLNDVPRENWPNVALVFQTYHAMVALGVFFIGITLLACFLWWRGTLFRHRWLLWVFVFAVLGAYAANQLGWVSAEAGRQPWIVWGQLRTSEGLSESVTGGMVLTSLILFSVIYLLLFAVWVLVMNAKIQHGPEPVVVPGRPTTPDDLLEVAARRTNPSGYSMSAANVPTFDPDTQG